MNLQQVDSISSTELTKANLKKYIVEQLSQEPEVEKVIIFGSFLKSNTPNDIDIAIFQNSCQRGINLMRDSLSRKGFSFCQTE